MKGKLTEAGAKREFLRLAGDFSVVDAVNSLAWWDGRDFSSFPEGDFKAALEAAAKAAAEAYPKFAELVTLRAIAEGRP